MTQKNHPLADVKVVRRKSSAFTRIVIVTAIVLSIAALLTLQTAINAANRSTEALRQEAIVLEQESQRLEEYKSQKGTLQEILRIAQEKLGLTAPDSVIIQPK